MQCNAHDARSASKAPSLPSWAPLVNRTIIRPASYRAVPVREGCSRPQASTPLSIIHDSCLVSLPTLAPAVPPPEANTSQTESTATRGKRVRLLSEDVNEVKKFSESRACGKQALLHFTVSWPPTQELLPPGPRGGGLLVSGIPLKRRIKELAPRGNVQSEGPGCHSLSNQEGSQVSRLPQSSGPRSPEPGAPPETLLAASAEPGQARGGRAARRGAGP